MTQRKDDAKIPLFQHADPVDQAGFVMIPRAVLCRQDIGSEAKLIYGYLGWLAWYRRSDATESARDEIARSLNLSEKIVTKAIRQLALASTVEGDEGAPPLVISIRRGQGLPNIYRINRPGYMPDIPEVVRHSTPEQREAWKAVHRALREGVLVRLPCEVEGCEVAETDAHHEDYAKPLEVTWLCRPHHNEYRRSGKALSAFLEKPVRPAPARARSLPLNPSSENKEETPLPPLDEPPGIVLSGGRNLPLDALVEVCGITSSQMNTRMGQAVTALNGRLDRRGDLVEPGLRHLYWDEVQAQAVDRIPDPVARESRLRAFQADPERFARLLADRIRNKADAYRANMPGAILSPKSLRDWWYDIGTGARPASAGKDFSHLPDA